MVQNCRRIFCLLVYDYHSKYDPHPAKVDPAKERKKQTGGLVNERTIELEQKNRQLEVINYHGFHFLSHRSKYLRDAAKMNNDRLYSDF